MCQQWGRFLALSSFWKLPSTLSENAFAFLPLARPLLLPSVGSPFLDSLGWPPVSRSLCL